MTMTALRALAWKEWREQRGLVLAGLGLSASLPFILVAGASVSGGRYRRLAELADLMPGICAALIWPLFSAAAGAGAFAPEIGEGTSGFLLSRPVARGRLWTVKVAMAAGAALVILAGSLLVARLFGMAVREGPDPGIGSTAEAQGWAVGVPLVGSGILLLFASSVFFSTMLSRAMTAAAAGLAATLALLGALLLLWSRMDLVPRIEPAWLGAEIALMAAALLVTSRWVFARAEISGRRMARGTAGQATLLAGILIVLVTAPVLQAYNRLTPAVARLMVEDACLAPGSILATAMRPDGGSPQIWRVNLDGSGFDRIAGRLAFSPLVSSDGAWMVYLSLSGPFGLRSGSAQVRIARLGGSEDRLLTTVSPNFAAKGEGGLEASFSPGGDRLALASADQGLLVVELATLRTRTLDLASPGMKGQWLRLAGWTAGGDEILVAHSKGRSSGSSGVAAVRAADGALRRVYHAPGVGYLAPWPAGAGSSRGWSRLPLIVDTTPEQPGGLETILLDVATGRAELMHAGTPCFPGGDFSRDHRLIAYAVCLGAEGDWRSELFLRDAESGLTRPLAELPGRIGRIHLSPTATQILVDRFDAPGRRARTAVVSLEGKVTLLPEGWLPLGWQGRDRAVLADAMEATRLAVAEAGAWEPLIVYP